MLSKLESFRLMGVPSSQVLVSENDVNGMEFGFLARSISLEEQVQVQQGTDDDDDDEKQEDKEKRRRRVSVAPLKIGIPSQDDEEEEGGLKTPTSRVHRISEMQQCPGAPRKPKSIPCTKRKGCGAFLLDLSREIESLFPRPIVLDLGGQIKKVKQPM